MERTAIKSNGTGQQSEQTTAVPRKRRNPFFEQSKEEKERRQKKRARLIIRNISYKCKEDDIKKHFSQWGELEEVNLLKRPDGKLVGCAFVQYATVNQATKAIHMANNKELNGRAVFVDWAVGKDAYTAQQKGNQENVDKKPKVEVKEEEEENTSSNDSDEETDRSPAKKSKLEDEQESEEDDSEEDASDEDDDQNEASSESEADDDDGEDDESDEEHDSAEEDENSNAESDDEDEKDFKPKADIDKVKKEKHISNDVREGCTVFIKNVPFDVEDEDLRKLCRKFGPVIYAIINRERISGHSKGTAFVKFKIKDSADLCLQAGNELVLMDQILEPFPALSKEEIHTQANEKAQKKEGSDSRNLYLAREGLIMSGSKAADGVSASDMKKRHELEQMKTQVLKNLNRFVSRNRLSIHNLPLNYDNEKLRQMATVYSGFKPHECRVMRENQVTAEHPNGKPKGFGFVSFASHKEALTALRKLNNNPNIFSNQNRPIVAFSIEDRAVHKIKEKRAQKSKLNNPTYQQKLEQRKAARQQKGNSRQPQRKPQQPDNKAKLQRHIKKLEESRNKANERKTKKPVQEADDFMGTAAKPGTSLRMRSNKKINEQAQEHKKRVRENKRKQKQQKIRQIHLAERKAVIRPKQGRKIERDDLAQLVNKYKNLIGGGNQNKNEATSSLSSGKLEKKSTKKRTKWYTET